MWWNCQSFATQLAFLLVEMDIFRSVIASLSRSILSDCLQQAIPRRDQLLETANRQSWYAALGSFTCLLAFGAISSCPPLEAVMVPVYLITFAGGVLSGQTHDLYRQLDVRRFDEFRANMIQLEARFPVLGELHHHLNELGVLGEGLDIYITQPESVN